MAPSKKGKKPVKAPKGQKRKTLSLKQKNAKESKVVKVDSLQWKAVEVPDNLGDYEGFYGLEEIDGVDVKIVNGKAEFLVNDERKLKKDDDVDNFSGNEDEEEEEENENETEEGADNLMDEENEENASEGLSDDVEEFTGFEDEPTAPKESKKQKKKTQKPVQKTAKNASEDEDEDELRENAFKGLESVSEDGEIDLDGIMDIDMPHWTDAEAKFVLGKYVLNGLKTLGFDKPTPIQKSSIPLALIGKDVIGKASTGSGKTLAYGIPILEKYLKNLDHIKENTANKVANAPTGIIFAPTRELAHQVVDHLKALAKYTPLSQHGILNITGGLSIQKQERLLKHGPGVIVATPGRFLELIQKDEALLIRMASTDIVVLDEADRLLQQGHFEEFAQILELFGKHRPKKQANLAWKWQTLVFSATFSSDLFWKLDKNLKKPQEKAASLIDNDEILKLLTEKLKFKDLKPALVDANPKDFVSGQITEALVECGPTERDLYLYYFLLMYPGTTLIFANAIDSVKRLVPFFSNLKIPTFLIHSLMIQKQRLRAIERFKESTKTNKTSVLIASDVAARGLDIPNIDHVAHYHLPRSADIYIHRSGRTARAGKEGVSVMFCLPQEASGPLKKLRKMVATSAKGSKLNIHADVKLLPLDIDIVSQLKPRAALASKLANSTVSNTSTSKEDAWVKEAAEELGIDDLDELKTFEDDFLKRLRKRKEGKTIEKDEARAMRRELQQLLDVQLRKTHRKSYITSGLENLAHQMVSGNAHDVVIGHKNVNALEELKGKGVKIKKDKVGKTNVEKITQRNEKRKAVKDAKNKRRDAKKGKPAKSEKFDDESE